MDVMSQNSDPQLTTVYLCAAIAAPKAPLNAASIFLFLTAASCVLLIEKMGFFEFLNWRLQYRFDRCY